MPTEREFKRCIGRLEGYFTKPLNEEQAKIYWSKLKNIHDRDLDRVTEIFIETRRPMVSQFPTLSEILAAVAERVDKRQRRTEPTMEQEIHRRKNAASGTRDFALSCAEIVMKIFPGRDSGTGIPLQGMSLTQGQQAMLDAAVEHGIDLDVILPYAPSADREITHERRRALSKFCAFVDTGGLTKRPTPEDLRKLNPKWMITRCEEARYAGDLLKVIQEVV